jgi:hypothetical protein
MNKYDFDLPDYHGNSIVNLMSSISNCFDKKHDYAELSSLTSEELKKSKNIVLIVIDGLGYNYLIQQKESFLYKHIKATITSTFLTTTTCANTTFSVGYPPQQHGLTGWDMNLKEIGAITTVLPFVPMFGGESLEKANFKMEHIMDIPPFREGFNAECISLYNKNIATSAFSSYVSQHSKMIPTESYDDTFFVLSKLLQENSEKRRYFHTYISDFDSSAHKNGVNGQKTTDVFRDLDNKIETLTKNAKSDTKFIIVSDHGMIDNIQEDKLCTKDFKGFDDCLTIPLAGEPRVRDCFVRPRKVEQFKKIVKEQMSEYCWCFEGEQLINDNFYGLGTPNKKLFDRVGDFVLIMKSHYVLSYKLANYKAHPKNHIGAHGGITPDEMLIPLVVVS